MITAWMQEPNLWLWHMGHCFCCHELVTKTRSKWVFIKMQVLNSGDKSCRRPQTIHVSRGQLGVMRSPQQKLFCVLEVATSESTITIESSFTRKFKVKPFDVCWCLFNNSETSSILLESHYLYKNIPRNRRDKWNKIFIKIYKRFKMHEHNYAML